MSELLIRVPRGNTGLHRFVDELQEELNVKEVRFLEVGDELVTYRFKPNLPVAGKKYGRLVPKIKHALGSLSGQAAAATAYALEAEQPIEIQVDGQTIRLEPGEVLVEATSPSGYAVAEGNGLLVALNTALYGSDTRTEVRGPGPRSRTLHPGCAQDCRACHYRAHSPDTATGGGFRCNAHTGCPQRLYPQRNASGFPGSWPN